MTANIHPSAVIDPGAELAADVSVGPYAVIGPGVSLGAGCEVGASAQIQGPSRIGAGNRFFPHACIGFEPQDVKFGGEETHLEIGAGNQFREFCTVHRGTAQGGGLTTIGDDNYFLAYSHIAHDSRVGNRTTFVNNATLAGHVEVGDDATIGAFSSVHQFCRIGRHAYIGGYSVITRDALPYVKTVGFKPACYGLNHIGLKRKGFDADVLRRLSVAYRLLVRSQASVSHALDTLRTELAGVAEIDYLIDFVATAKRGVIRGLPGRQGSRGGQANS